MYEFFYITHIALALVTAVAILGHFPVVTYRNRAIFPITAMSLWAISTALRLGRMAYYNTGNKHGKEVPRKPQAIVEHCFVGSDNNTVSAMTLTIQPRRSFPIRPGQYFYLHFSDMGVRRRIHSRPYAISWWDNSLNAETLSFLIQPETGVSAELTSRSLIRTVCIDGPYGKDLKLENYENVILIAKGIGIAGIMSYIRHMTYRRVSKDKEHEAYKRGQITRKIDVYWEMEDNSQQNWVSEWMEQLHEKDADNVRSISIYYGLQP